MRRYVIFFLTAVGIFMIDQGLKDIFVDGYLRYGSCISLELHLNRGVAFSMFAFLGEWLKWIQALLIAGLFIFLYIEKFIVKYPVPTAVLAGAAVGNLYDRFIYGGVVDYIYWHCGFDFPVFNFADVMIDVSVASLLILWYIQDKRESQR